MKMQVFMIAQSVHVITKYSPQGSKSFLTFSCSVCDANIVCRTISTSSLWTGK